MRPNVNFLDRLFIALAPGYGFERIRNRAAAELFTNSAKRHYEAAQAGRRTQGWVRSSGDANAVNRNALVALRDNTRDLVRNNVFAGRALNRIVSGTIGTGIRAKPVDDGVRANKRAREAWSEWTETTQCDADGRLNYYGLQKLAMRMTVESGECLCLRVPRPSSDGLAIPLQLRLLEPDFLDTSKDGIVTAGGGRIIQGVEYDAHLRRAAYWLFPHSPSDGWRGLPVSKRVPATEVISTYEMLRAGQVRGVPWFAPAIVKFKDLDEYDDATLMKQKIAACFAGFITDSEPDGVALSKRDDPANPDLETMEPGTIVTIPPGKDVTFSSPPTVGDYRDFSVAQLQAIAVGLGVSYEELSGDFSRVNFSSARMSRMVFMENVEQWRWQTFIPHFCDGTWNWAQQSALVAGIVPKRTRAAWTAPPWRMIEPDKEGLAIGRRLRNGLQTPDDAVREQGYDPQEHWQEFADNLKRLDALGIVLDSDPRRTTQAGNPVPAAKPDGSAKPKSDKQGQDGAPAA